VAYLAIALAVLACASLVWIAGVRGARDLRPRERILEVPGLPAQLDGVRVMHLSDLHLRPRSEFPDRLLQAARHYRPDFVIITGDLVWGDAGLAVAEGFLRTLASEFPVWVVEGNADHWADRTGELRARWRQTGAHFLNNTSAPLAEGTPPAWIAGVDDPYRRRDDLDAADREVPADAWVLLLAHSPDILERPPSRRAGLVFAGHTHGGQVCIPGLGPVFTHIRLGRRFVEGVHRVDDTIVAISRGAGVTRLPIRLWCPPELTTWRLTAR
jgi:predicted MPP superfamily phosphohydrolase